MDPTIFIGLLLAVGILVDSIGIHDGLKLFMNREALTVVIGGLISATFVNFPMAQLRSMGGWVKALFFSNRRNHLKDTLLLLNLCYKMHREGRMALEKEIVLIKDVFMKQAMVMIMNKAEPAQIKILLKEMIEQTEKRHDQGIHYFEQMAKYAPGFALVGTLMGLVKLLSHVSDPKSIGPSMAIALVSTFYGVSLSNLLFLPLAGRLKVSSYAEALHKEILIEGIISMASGELPFAVREKI